MQNNNDNAQITRRIEWKCRRGMLELDFLLERFFRHYFVDLSASEKKTFDELLDEADARIYAWVMGYEVAPKQYQKIINEINNF